MAAGISDPAHWKNDQISSITDLYKYLEPNECCRALVGAWSYVHVQLVPAAVWTINHSLHTTDVVNFGYNAEILGQDMLDWTSLVVVDSNTIVVTWPEPRTGRVVVVSSGSRPNPNLELFLQFIDTYPSFYTEKFYDADEYMTSVVKWDAPAKVLKLFTITYTYVNGLRATKTVKHELNSQLLTITYTYDANENQIAVTRVITMV